MPPLNPFSLQAASAIGGGAAAGGLGGLAGLAALASNPVTLGFAAFGAASGFLDAQSANRAARSRVHAFERARRIARIRLSQEFGGRFQDNVRSLREVAGHLAVRTGAQDDSLELQAQVDAARNAQRIQAQFNAQLDETRRPFSQATTSPILGAARGAFGGFQQGASTLQTIESLRSIL